ncbi:MAG: methylated-DNA--[protein]-cysteine S-methyltransferase [Flavobacteriaceae bacterium]|nr:methylated-DNA--[protein]-cysteine S-methyltransferase [Flavobacteriaceae bacterium]
METAYLETPIGTLQCKGDANGLATLYFIEESIPTSQKIPKDLENTIYQLQEYFDGKRTDFDLKLAPQGTDFQKRVWKQLQTIPFGKTCSYLDMAKALGDPKVIRAAASANGKNPLSIIIPCHRVIGSDGTLTGYAGGISRKKWLLEHEQPFKQQTLF